MATRKEDKIKIPESVLNRANRSIIEASYGITGQERERYNIPKFPSFGGSTFLNPNPQFGFATSTMLDQELPATRMEEQVVDYSRDAGTRMANRYTMPISDLGVSDFRSGGFRTQLPTSRVGATAYSNPEMASNLEREKSEYIQPTQGVGQSGFGRKYTFGNREVQQIVSPYGFAQTSFTPQQVEQGAQARQEAEQRGTLPRTPEQQQALLAQMRQLGAGMREREAQRQQELTKGYYAFRQRLEQDRFQRAMSQAEKEQSRGGSGREAMRRAEQARYGGEIMRQAGANVGTGQRTPFFSWERASMPSGEQFYRGSMGQYSRVAGTGSQFGGVRGGPQPAAATPTAPQPSQAFNLMTPMPTLSSPQSSLGGPSYSGFNLFDPLRGIYGV